ncbi:hypothetical protein GWK47_015676 [Chionoecetes opilio]|uniref:Uncharacterized protein n=1 Tax=Chionoecetes opilio TaxID=41210 RepID=A0A8J4Y2U4_CHIOP|nr:hypothetical protein GWK47_015676 [Chionoecetes opilio]
MATNGFHDASSCTMLPANETACGKQRVHSSCSSTSTRCEKVPTHELRRRGTPPRRGLPVHVHVHHHVAGVYSRSSSPLFTLRLNSPWPPFTPNGVKIAEVSNSRASMKKHAQKKAGTKDVTLRTQTQLNLQRHC